MAECALDDLWRGELDLELIQLDQLRQRCSPQFLLLTRGETPDGQRRDPDGDNPDRKQPPLTPMLLTHCNVSAATLMFFPALLRRAKTAIDRARTFQLRRVATIEAPVSSRSSAMIDPTCRESVLLYREIADT